jgi:hypothetical protein
MNTRDRATHLSLISQAENGGRIVYGIAAKKPGAVPLEKVAPTEERICAVCAVTWALALVGGVVMCWALAIGGLWLLRTAGL